MAQKSGRWRRGVLVGGVVAAILGEMPALPPLYLDPLLPIMVRRDAARIPEVAGTQPACALVREAARLSWVYPATESRMKVRAKWLIVLGQRILDQLVVSAYGEPGFCRFLEGLSTSGSAPLGETDASFEDWMAALEQELADRPPAFRARGRALVTDIVLSLYRATLTSEVTDPRSAIAFSELIDHIELHYDEQLELDDLARMMQTSPSHLSRIFSRELGVPLFEYINRTRIRNACLLLRRTEFSVTRIAVEVGYNNVSYFNRYFRRIMQCSPREYRRSVTQ